ncbi:hypothetical protein NPIL_62391 [Nephila pilipes]|uniref:Uncharacterized protein n=1 Tax=Nephila pilipes TaxID=299642 RepID=A0A8X6MW55_NEPPI|nr:hypothetical protein NPIL_62391 [Nephila pilipes]
MPLYFYTLKRIEIFGGRNENNVQQTSLSLREYLTIKWWWESTQKADMGQVSNLDPSVLENNSMSGGIGEFIGDDNLHIMGYKKNHILEVENYAPGIDRINEEKLQRNVREEHQIKKHTRKVFHLEYLEKMITHVKSEKPNAMKLRDVKFAEYDKLKSFNWELKKATEVPPEREKEMLCFSKI